MKEKIIEKQDEIIANLKEVGQFYFKIKDDATKQDVIRMASLTTKGKVLDAELDALKAQDIPSEPLINQEVEKRIKERMPSEEEINNEANNYGELAKDNTPDYGVEENASLDFLRGASWLRSRLTEKPNNSERQMWRDIQEEERELPE